MCLFKQFCRIFFPSFLSSSCQPLLEDPLEEGMATHASILAWRVPWTEAPGGLQSTGSQLKPLSTSMLSSSCKPIVTTNTSTIIHSTRVNEDRVHSLSSQAFGQTQRGGWDCLFHKASCVLTAFSHSQGGRVLCISHCPALHLTSSSSCLAFLVMG